MICDLQKASIWKRLSAWLLDAILVCILAVGGALLVALITNYDAYDQRLNQIYQQYELEYKTTHGLTDNQFNNMSDEQRTAFEQELNVLLQSDNEFVKVYSITVSLIFIEISIGILLAFTVLEFVLPLIFKHGRTLGKKVFGLAVMRSDGVKISNVSLFIRCFLGKYTIETMVPVLLFIMLILGMLDIVGLIVLVGIFIFQLILVITTANNSLIHDVLSDTVVVDYNSQMIFDNEQSLVDYTNKIHAEQSAKKEY